VADPGEGGQQLPPPSEEIHIPEPSYLPALTALGIPLVVVGIVLWIRQTREEIAELPLEH